jgi:hypothetical protein
MANPLRILAVPFLLFNLTAALAAQAPLFTPWSTPVAGGEPLSIAIADLDGDEIMDLVTVNGWKANAVTVHLGLARGRYEAPTSTRVVSAAAPLSAAIADVNVDGFLDIVTANASSSNVSVLINSSGGSFDVQSSVAVGSFAGYVATHDLNSDGSVDLAVTHSPNDIVVLLNAGSGEFGAPTAFFVGSNYFANSIAIGDVNGDGKPDVATANVNPHNASILIGDGTGSFGSAKHYAVGINPCDVKIGDVNGDLKLDLMTANGYTNDVSVRLGTGSGDFGPKSDYPVGITPFWLAVGDLNEDGRQDLVTANSVSNDVSVLLGSIGGTFAPSVAYGVGVYPNSVAIADLDGNGTLDLATANQASNTVSVLVNTGKP